MPQNVGYVLSGVAGFLQVCSLLIGMVGYIFGGIGLYTICRRRCIPNAWMAWVPVLQVWVLGSVSDQYRYVAKGQVKSKRKVLLILEIITLLLSAGTTAQIIRTLMTFAEVSYYGTEAEIPVGINVPRIMY